MALILSIVIIVIIQRMTFNLTVSTMKLEKPASAAPEAPQTITMGNIWPDDDMIRSCIRAARDPAFRLLMRTLNVHVGTVQMGTPGRLTLAPGAPVTKTFCRLKKLVVRPRDTLREKKFTSRMIGTTLTLPRAVFKPEHRAALQLHVEGMTRKIVATMAAREPRKEPLSYAAIHWAETRMPSPSTSDVTLYLHVAQVDPEGLCRPGPETPISWEALASSSSSPS